MSFPFLLSTTSTILHRYIILRFAMMKLRGTSLIAATQQKNVNGFEETERVSSCVHKVPFDRFNVRDLVQS